MYLPLFSLVRFQTGFLSSLFFYSPGASLLLLLDFSCLFLLWIRCVLLLKSHDFFFAGVDRCSMNLEPPGRFGSAPSSSPWLAPFAFPLFLLLSINPLFVPVTTFVSLIYPLCAPFRPVEAIHLVRSESRLPAHSAPLPSLLLHLVDLASRILLSVVLCPDGIDSKRSSSLPPPCRRRRAPPGQSSSASE